MAKYVEEVILGIDVSLKSLDLFGTGFNRVLRLANEVEAIRDYLVSLHGPVSIAVEATNDFHEALIDIALELGFTVYVVDGYKLSKYREAVGIRAKTDPGDARLIYRYLVSERDSLRPIVPQNQQERLIWRLLKRWAKVVKLRKQLRLSLRGIGVVDADKDTAIAGLKQLIDRLTREAGRLAREAHWGELKTQHLARGLSEIQSSVILSRKLARIGYAILRDEAQYEAPV